MANQIVSSFILPNEYERKIAEAKRREAMAKMLAQQQYQPLEGSAAPTPSYAPLVQGLQSYLLARELKKGQEAKDAATELEGQSARQISGRLQGGRVSEPTPTGMESQPVKDFYQMRGQMAEPILQEEYQRIEAEKNAPMPKNPTVDDLQPVIPTAQYTRSPRDALGVASTAVGQAALQNRPFLGAQLAEALKPVTKEFTGTPFIDENGNAIIIDKNTGLPTALKNPDGTPIKGPTNSDKPYEYQALMAQLAQLRANNPSGVNDGAIKDIKARMASINYKPVGSTQIVNTGRKISEEIVEKGVDFVTNSQVAAQSASENKTTNATMREYLKQPIFTGTGTTFKIAFSQIFNKNPEKLVATRNIIKGLAESTVAARKRFSGQGAISNFEQETLAKAASGNIDNLSPLEIQTIIDVNERTNDYVIDKHQKVMEQARKAFESGNPTDFLTLFEVFVPKSVGENIVDRK